ncbi:hypothetical protein EVAR_103436_1 [Eumeta japonica]|uniref:Uncharacterized protein n=1 Tax=Eumeta variegata TaxID=151549 RepID=A0A4C1SXC4_EUMVA|nr:hypothetical protein EVAR_103436_1 [Eumeta japonica]
MSSNKSFRVHFVVLKHTRPPHHLVLKNRKLHQYWKDGFILNSNFLAGLSLRILCAPSSCFLPESVLSLSLS